jgi:hypothetical protein
MLPLEFTLSGTKSAGNPWHQYIYWPEGGEGTRFLDDPILEKKLVLKGKASYPWKDFAFSLDFAVGGVWNRLALTAVESTDSANQGHNLFSFSGERLHREAGPVRRLETEFLRAAPAATQSRIRWPCLDVPVPRAREVAWVFPVDPKRPRSVGSGR